MSRQTRPFSADAARDAARLDSLEAEYGRVAARLKELRHG